VPPLATALAVAGVGVVIALARVQLERRSERARAVPERPARSRPALLPGEPLAEGVRQVILGQLDLAVALLEGDPGVVDGLGAQATTVHETRKTLKRLRALVALLRQELGRERCAREGTVLRDCARRLAGSRDAEVAVATLEGLLARRPALADSPAVDALRAELLAERDVAAARGVGDPLLRAAVAGELRAARARVERWELRERRFRAVAPGLEHTYRRGRRGLRDAQRRGDGATLHVWRKRVKNLRYAAETLDRVGAAEGVRGGGSAAGARERKAARRRAREARWVRRAARRADRLGEVLGEEHDLALLARGVRERSALFAADRRARRRLLQGIARRRRTLRKRALREGERLYRHPPRRFVRRVRAAQ
jgi:hypothetical protein